MKEQIKPRDCTTHNNIINGREEKCIPTIVFKCIIQRVSLSMGSVTARVVIAYSVAFAGSEQSSMLYTFKIAILQFIPIFSDILKLNVK